MRRWGRWRSLIANEYVWRDSSGFLALGDRIAPTKGLTEFSAEAAPLRKKTRPGPSTLYRNGGSFIRPHVSLIYQKHAILHG